MKVEREKVENKKKNVTQAGAKNSDHFLVQGLSL
jgi:hypothetical protein